jgi:hypothetical protein
MREKSQIRPICSLDMQLEIFDHLIAITICAMALLYKKRKVEKKQEEEKQRRRHRPRESGVANT